MTRALTNRWPQTALYIAAAACAALAQACTSDAPVEGRDQPRSQADATPDAVTDAPPTRPAPIETRAADTRSRDAAAAPSTQDAADAAAPSAVTRTRAEPVDAATIEGARQQIAAERRWATLVTSPTNEFVTAIGPLFDEWSRVLIALSAAGQHAEADGLCAAIVELRNHLGPSRLPVERFDSFLRDRVWVGDRRVEAAQFFEPLRLHPGDGRVLTLYRLSVYEEGRVVARYYLERVTLDSGVGHVLGVVDATTAEHVEVARLGPDEPSYWVVRERALRDVEERFGADR